MGLNWFKNARLIDLLQAPLEFVICGNVHRLVVFIGLFEALLGSGVS